MRQPRKLPPNKPRRFCELCRRPIFTKIGRCSPCNSIAKRLKEQQERKKRIVVVGGL